MGSMIPFGDGWITGIDPASPDADITAALIAIGESPCQARHEREPGQLRYGPAGCPPTHLTALDGETHLALSAQLTEFYAHARSWRHSVLLNNVIDPDDYLDHLTDPRLGLPELLDQELEAPGALVDAHGQGLDLSRCALFWLDTLAAVPYNRAYLVFSPPGHSRTAGAVSGEPEIWGFENEHFHAPDLRSYLAERVAAGRADATGALPE